MERVVERKVFYRCSRCKTKYTNKAEALRCEKRTLETKVFKVGNPVKNIEPRFCRIKQKEYFFSGTVTRIVGPEPSDYEYEVKWLGGKKERLNAHVFMYQVEFHCPRCKKTKRARYYAPELKLISRR